MDFDLESFMNEVSQALRHNSPAPTAGKRPIENIDNITDNDGDSHDMDSSTESDENPMYSAVKRRRLDFPRRDSFHTDSSTSCSDDDEVDSFQEDEEEEDDIPSFFHPSM